MDGAGRLLVSTQGTAFTPTAWGERHASTSASACHQESFNGILES